MVIIGTHCDKLKGEERERRKAELNEIITRKYLVGRGPQQLREMGLPKILGVFYVSCPTSGHGEGITKLRMALYDIAFSLSAPGKGTVHVCAHCMSISLHVCTNVCVCVGGEEGIREMEGGSEGSEGGEADVHTKWLV